MQQGAHLSLVAPLLHAWGYPPALIGVLVSAISVASLLCRVPAGLLYRREQARRVLAVAVPATALLLLAHPFAASPGTFLLVRLLSGVAYGLGTTINLARFIDEQPPGPGRARVMGYFVACIAIGYSIGSAVVGYVVEAWGFVAAFASGAALVALGTLGTLDRTPVAAGGTESGAAEASQATVAAEQGRPPWRTLLTAPAFLVLAFEAFLLNAQWSFWNAWLPLYSLAVGISLAETGILRTVYGLFNAGGRLVAGEVVARWGASRLAVVCLALQCSLLLLLPPLPFMAPLLVLFMVMGTLRALGVVANTVAVIERGEAHGVARGPLVGALNCVTDVGLLAGPALGGLVAQVTGPVQVFVAWPLTMLVCYGLVLAAGRAAAQRTATHPA